jgi:hypothetical protein
MLVLLDVGRVATGRTRVARGVDVKRGDPIAVAVANVVKAAFAWQELALRDRAASRRVGVEQQEAQARLFAAVEALKAARRADKFLEEQPTSRMKKT